LNLLEVLARRGAWLGLTTGLAGLSWAQPATAPWCLLGLGAAAVWLAESARAAEQRRVMGLLAAPALPLGGPPDPITEVLRARDAGQRHEEAVREGDLRRILRTAQRTAERGERLIDAAPVGVLLMDRSGTIERVNPAATELLTPRRSPRGASLLEVFPIAELLDVVAAVQSGETMARRTAAVGELDIALEAAPVDAGVMVIVRDESEARRTERARTQFVANVSHELRTPVAILLGYVEALLDDSTLTSDQRSMVEALERSGKRLRRLFDDLLTLYRAETRFQGFALEPMPLRSVVVEALGTALEMAARRGVTLTVDIAPDRIVPLHAPSTATVVANLVQNALRFTPAGGSVRVLARDEGEAVALDVVDTGCGIAAHHLERIFERFYRVDEGRSRDAGGTGLGLAIVKHVTAAVGATVSVQSVEGQGSTFTVRLPVRVAPVEPTRWDV
jgi:two-component system phosphate regulon sensor histidine kinase PhoR